MKEVNKGECDSVCTEAIGQRSCRRVKNAMVYRRLTWELIKQQKVYKMLLNLSSQFTVGSIISLCSLLGVPLIYSSKHPPWRVFQRCFLFHSIFPLAYGICHTIPRRFSNRIIRFT